MLIANDKIFRLYSKLDREFTISKSTVGRMEKGLPMEGPRHLLIWPKKPAAYRGIEPGIF